MLEKRVEKERRLEERRDEVGCRMVEINHNERLGIKTRQMELKEGGSSSLYVAHWTFQRVSKSPVTKPRATNISNVFWNYIYFD